jgi:hypothetical protein
MRLAVIAAIVGLIVGLGVGYLQFGGEPFGTRPAVELVDELDALKKRHAQQTDELRKTKEELAAERDMRQRLEEVISKGKK